MLFYSIYITMNSKFSGNNSRTFGSCFLLFFIYYLYYQYVIFWHWVCTCGSVFRKLENLFRCGFRKTGRKHLGLYFVNNCSDWRNWLEVFYQKTDKFITFTIISKGHFVHANINFTGAILHSVCRTIMEYGGTTDSFAG